MIRMTRIAWVCSCLAWCAETMRRGKLDVARNWIPNWKSFLQPLDNICSFSFGFSIVRLSWYIMACALLFLKTCSGEAGTRLLMGGLNFAGLSIVGWVVPWFHYVSLCFTASGWTLEDSSITCAQQACPDPSPWRSVVVPCRSQMDGFFV